MLPFAIALLAAAQPQLQPQLNANAASVSISDDGKLLAAAGALDMPQIWDLTTGRLLRTLGGRGRIGALAFARGGHTIITCGKLGVDRWDAGSGKLLQPVKSGECYETNFRLSADRKRFTKTSFGEVSIFDSSSGAQLARIGLDASKFPDQVALNADGSRVAVYFDSDHRIDLYDAAGGSLQASIANLTRGVRTLAFSPDGAFLATDEFAASADPATASVRLYDARSGAALRAVPAERTRATELGTALAFSPDSRRLLAGGSDYRLIDVASGAVALRLSQGAVAESLRHGGAAFSSDGSLIVTGRVQPRGGLSVWDAATGRLLRELSGASEPVTEVAFGAGGTSLLVLGFRSLRGLDLATLRPLRVAAPELQRDEFVKGLTVLPDGSALAATGRTLQVLPASGAARRLEDAGGQITDVAVSADGRRAVLALLSESVSPEVPVVAFDLASGKKLWQQRLKPAAGTFGSVYLRALAVNADGSRVAVGVSRSQGVDTKELLVTLDGATGAAAAEREVGIIARSYAFAPDGRLYLGGQFGSLHQVAPASLFELAPQGDAMAAVSAAIAKMAFSPDGKLLAAASTSGSALIFDATSGKLLHTLAAHEGWATGVAFSPDGKRIATAGWDAAVRLWEAASGKPIATVVQVEGGEDVIALPSGVYAASRGASRGVAFRLGERAFPFEQFDLQLNRPHQVLAALGAASPKLVDAYRRAFEKRLGKMGLSESMLAPDFELPVISLASAGPPLSTKDRRLTVRVRAQDRSHALHHLNVLVNDVPVDGAHGRPLPEKGAKKTELDVPLELSAGLNKVQISVVNDRLAESLRVTFQVTYDGPAKKGETWVVAVGVSKYEDPSYELKYAAKDARDLAALFEARGAHVLRVLDGDAKKERLAAAREFLSKATVDDTVVLFAAGHGLLDESLDYYFATADTDFAHPAARGLPYGAFEDLLDGIAARRKLLLVDTCNSGEVDKEEAQLVAQSDSVKLAGAVQARAVRGVKAVRAPFAQGGARELARELFADLRRGSGAAVISSASGLQFALESDVWQNGVFTFAVLEGLKTGRADADKDGQVRVSELRDYVLAKVVELTAGRQTPTVRRDALDFDFVVY